MSTRAVTRDHLAAFLAAYRRRGPEEGALFLVGPSTQLWERWRDVVPALSLGAEGESREVVGAAAEAAAAELGVPISWDSPGDAIPLPDGTDGRHRAVENGPGPAPAVLHYDPYSVICRGVVRGEEDDYRTAVAYLRHGWADDAELMALVERLLPRFDDVTSGLDPAEFRRRFKGLLQLWRASPR